MAKRSRIGQMDDRVNELERAGFKVRKVEPFTTYFLVSTNHGGEGATSRWSSSWVRRYEFDAKL